jgi:endonuclease G
MAGTCDSVSPTRAMGGFVNLLEKRLSRLRNFNAWVESDDPKLADEAADLANTAVSTEAFEVGASSEALEYAVNLESITLRRTRPVLAIKENVTELVFLDEADSPIWKQRLADAQQTIDRAIRAVGRINISGSNVAWIGTGWLVSTNILVTNRHVARAFTRRDGDAFTFGMGERGPIGADVDFLQEIDNAKTLSFKLIKPVHIQDASGPDIAFFEIEIVGGDAKLAEPLALAAKPAVTKNAAVIGYPAYDSRIPETELMERIFGKVYNKKRLAPGAVTAVADTRILHNCSTLAGNSGSAVVDLDSGEALGLHFSGTFLTTNYAVRADIVQQLLDKVRSGRALRTAGRVAVSASATVPPLQISAALPNINTTATITLPLSITFSLGAATSQLTHSRPLAIDIAGEVAGEESVAKDYLDRSGYDPIFLGDRMQVNLPTVDGNTNDVLDFSFDGKTETELKYEHYSVVMSRSRRMCFFSACNLDGGATKKSARVGWKWDPRIPKAQQIMNECYGNPPKFSRGHMTRREDPGWGDRKTAKRGNEDSMHVTNTIPQMQAFNSPIWLALEDYALQHARQDEMKISVFTGPYFSVGDPTMYGVRIPLAFWKIIAFIHDSTGKLCATGYEMSQEKTLQPEEEYIFGPFASPLPQMATQVSIRSIATKSGIRFGHLESVDPLGDGAESIGGDGVHIPLHALEEIQFL